MAVIDSIPGGHDPGVVEMKDTAGTGLIVFATERCLEGDSRILSNPATRTHQLVSDPPFLGRSNLSTLMAT